MHMQDRDVNNDTVESFSVCGSGHDLVDIDGAIRVKQEYKIIVEDRSDVDVGGTKEQ
jgi:hypothetical protein